MERTRYRKKAMQIESQLLGKLAIFGQGRLAHLLGVHESQISRWKSAHGHERESFFATVSMILAVLEYGVDDTEIVELARRFAAALTKKKPPAGTDGSQITLNF